MQDIGKESIMTRWLRCVSIKGGLFSDERTVEIRERGNGNIGFIVPQDVVNEEAHAVLVKVYEYEGGTWALIPTPQPEPIPIEDEELLPA